MGGAGEEDGERREIIPPIAVPRRDDILSQQAGG
jgi:hypothetical protein